MPYINPIARLRLNPSVASVNPHNEGELNYVLTCVVRDFIKREGKCYATIATAVSALECCKLELYRRVAAPYEDEKIDENGDVY